jgi:hypothetical protein
MERYSNRIRKTLSLSVVSRARNREVTVAFNFVSGRLSELKTGQEVLITVKRTTAE